MIAYVKFYLDEFDHDLTSWRHWNDGECIGIIGNHPQMATSVSYFQVNELL